MGETATMECESLISHCKSSFPAFSLPPSSVHTTLYAHTATYKGKHPKSESIFTKLIQSNYLEGEIKASLAWIKEERKYLISLRGYDGNATICDHLACSTFILIGFNIGHGGTVWLSSLLRCFVVAYALNKSLQLSLSLITHSFK